MQILTLTPLFISIYWEEYPLPWIRLHWTHNCLDQFLWFMQCSVAIIIFLIGRGLTPIYTIEHTTRPKPEVQESIDERNPVYKPKFPSWGQNLTLFFLSQNYIWNSNLCLSVWPIITLEPMTDLPPILFGKLVRLTGIFLAYSLTIWVELVSLYLSWVSQLIFKLS